jgi:hypothetical protein
MHYKGCPAKPGGQTKPERAGQNTRPEVRQMAIQPNPNFPLLESDQADVIRIFLELIEERSRPAHGLEVKTVTKALESRNNSDDSRPPSELFDYE